MRIVVVAGLWAIALLATPVVAQESIVGAWQRVTLDSEGQPTPDPAPMLVVYTFVDAHKPRSRAGHIFQDRKRYAGHGGRESRESRGRIGADSIPTCEASQVRLKTSSLVGCGSRILGIVGIRLFFWRSKSLG